MKKNKNSFVRYLPILLLVTVAVFISFYRLKDFYRFDYDQERDYQVIASIISDIKPTLIGPRAVSSAGFYLGPWYYYLLLPFFVAFNGHPLYAAFVAGLINVLSAVLLYFLVKSKTNSLAAGIAALSWLSVLHRISWNVMFLPLLILAILYFLLRPKQTMFTLASLFFILSLGIHFHFQMILFFPLVLLYFIFTTTKFPRFTPALILSLFFAILLPLLPLILFDLRHDFLNTNAFYHFFIDRLQGTSQLNYLNLLAFSFRNIIREISLFTPWSLSLDYYLLPFSYLALILYFYKTKQRTYLIISLFPLISLLVLSLYSPPNWPEYYHLSASFVFIALTAIAVSSSTTLTKMVFVIVILNLFTTTKTLLISSSEPFAYLHKEKSMLYILNSTKPLKPQINADFPYGQGLGFTPIRDYHQKNFDTEYDLTRHFLIAYPDNPKHNDSMKVFGGLAVSEFREDQ